MWASGQWTLSSFSHTWEALGRNSCRWVSLWRRRLPPFPFSPWTPRVSSPHVDFPAGVKVPDGPGGCPSITSPPPGGPTCSLSYPQLMEGSILNQVLCFITQTGTPER